MNLYKITHPSYKGEIEVMYSNGSLQKFDMATAELSNTTKESFKAKVPVSQDEFLKGNWCGKSTVVVEATIEVELKDFTRNYPYQRNTHLLPPIWDKMPLTDKLLAVQRALPYSKYCQREDKWYKPKIAAAWLKNKEYLNDWNKM